MELFLNIFKICFIWIVSILIEALIIGAIIMVLWNWLMSGIFELGIITYWQGCGISLLTGLLFKGVVTVESK